MAKNKQKRPRISKAKHPTSKAKKLPAAKVAKKVAKKSSKSSRQLKSILVIIILATTVFSLGYVNHSVNVANQFNVAAIKDASSMLAYNKDQIETARVVGSKSQLVREIKDFSRASSDLQNYITEDYKEFKKNCVVNGDIVGAVSYEVVKVANNQFALVSRGCNGTEDTILAKIGGRWSAVFTGNTLIDCDQVNIYNIPQTITRNCQLNGQIYLNPNP